MVKIFFFFLNLLIYFLNIIMMYPFWRKTKPRTKTVAQRPTHDPDHKTVAQIETVAQKLTPELGPKTRQELKL